jgi:NADP-dependent 3-hydroxy acid dehydrogenase YdfG
VGESDGKFAKIDLLVNAAGVLVPKPFLEQTMEDYDRYLELNGGIFFVTQHVAKGMVDRARADPLSTSGRCGPGKQLGQPSLLPIQWPKQASIH